MGQVGSEELLVPLRRGEVSKWVFAYLCVCGKVPIPPNIVGSFWSVAYGMEQAVTKINCTLLFV